MNDNNDDNTLPGQGAAFEPSGKLAFDMTLALYLDLVSLLERNGVVSYRQMAARVLSISMNAREDGNQPLASALEGIAQGFAGRGDGLSINTLRVANDLRNDEAMGDIPMRPEGL
ncbi:hypothetical protein [Pseudacidovorax sp. RU35E]|uniref:hypothetical protein n=1 Tax=Pseudacidovorax sp. RU35E TaxID=1907403 RepID=UPI0009567CC2|nr:hypothetical protein [Pseudacidovorax sp. RU35E]SIP98879.1 hypothetical protein SAMN05880557_101417 [Pseudacidovorax sp. RU35E]